MYVWSSHIARVWINWVRLPILLVVSRTGKMNISLSAFAPENLVSRDGFGNPVPRQPAHLHTRAESGAYLRDSSEFRDSLLLFISQSDRGLPKCTNDVLSARYHKLLQSAIKRYFYGVSLRTVYERTCSSRSIL